MTTTEYLIIGNSAGAIGAAEAIRAVDRRGRLTIVTEEDYPAYSRPLISELVSHERTPETMLFRHAGFYRDLDIRLLTGARVASIKPAAGEAMLENGDIIKWGKLLLATGGKPIVPPMKGGELEGVFNFISLSDALRIDSYLVNVNRAVVIGGGLIGISLTEALAKRGVIVSVVEMKERVLNTILDEEASQDAGRMLTREGITVITNNTVAEITGQGRVDGVMLADGTRIPCEFVAVAIGVQPRTELARQAGLRVNRGIAVDRNMQTSHPGIYACGDAAEAWDFAVGADRLTPVWPNAYIGGRAAGANMAGAATEYRGGTAMNSINYFGMDIVSAGLVQAPEETGWETLAGRGGGAYRKLILHDNVIRGLIFVKDIDRAGIIFGLMREGADVSGYKHLLLSDDFGLADLPAALRKEKMGAPAAGGHVITLAETDETPIAGE
jgi:NAD(P)H-nitrite reductase large subunit